MVEALCSLKNGIKILDVNKNMVAIATIENEIIFALNLSSLNASKN